jgi:hypothetical protein
MPYKSGVVAVGSTAVLIATVGASVPENEGVRIKNTGSATVYVGGSAVTSASGFPVSSSDGVVNIPSTGAASESLYGIAATAGPFSVSYIHAG